MDQPTTFGALIFGNFNSPWWMIAIGIGAALFGMFSHWAKIAFKGQAPNLGMLDYFFIKNINATIVATLGMLGGLFAAFAPLDYTTLTLYQVVIQAFSIGYASDSILNSGWTLENPQPPQSPEGDEK